MHSKKNYIVVKDRHPYISEVLNDCVSLCVPASRNESLGSILQKMCAKIRALEIEEETDPIFEDWLDGFPQPEDGEGMVISSDGTNYIWSTVAAGTVSNFLFTDGNGFDGTVTLSTSTPTLALTTNIGQDRVLFAGPTGGLLGVSGFTFNGVSTLRLGASSLTSGILALHDAGGAGIISITAPALTGTWTLTLPSDNGNANEVLITNGSGVTDWVDVNTLVTVTDTNFANTDLTLTGARTHDGGGFDFTLQNADNIGFIANTNATFAALGNVFIAGGGGTGVSIGTTGAGDVWVNSDNNVRLYGDAATGFLDTDFEEIHLNATTKIFLNEGSLAGGVSNGYIWTLVDNATGEGEWAAAPAGYTDEQAQDAVGTILADGNGFNFTYDDVTPAITLETSVTTGQVIYANAGDIAGDTGFTWDTANKIVAVNKTVGVVGPFEALYTATTQRANESVSVGFEETATGAYPRVVFNASTGLGTNVNSGFVNQLDGANQWFFGMSNDGTFGGVAGAASGRYMGYYDYTVGAWRYGFNASGELIVGASAATFGAKIAQNTGTSIFNTHITFTDNTYDIGASGATRPRTGYFGTSLMSPQHIGSPSANGTISIIGNNAGAGNTATNQNILFMVGNTPTKFMDILNNGLVRIGSGNTTTSGYGLVVDQPDDAANTKGIFISANNHTVGMSIGYQKISYPASLQIEGLGGIQLLGAASGVKMTMTSAGLFFFGGTTTPTAFAHLAAGTTTIAPLKFIAGTNLTAAEAGAMEWNGTNLFVTQTTGPTRKTLAYTTDIPDIANYVGASTYLPTLTNTTNLTGSTAHTLQYSWVTDPGSGLTVVTVSGYVEVQPSAAGNTELTISIPIATSFGNIQECGGTANSTEVAGQSAGIRAVASSGDVMMQWVAVDTDSHPMYLTFTYKVTPP